MIGMLYTNKIFFFSVVFSLPVLVAIHQVLINRFISAINVKIGFIDSILLFKIPCWRRPAGLTGEQLRFAKKLSRQFVWAAFAYMAYFVVGYLHYILPMQA